MVRGGRRRPRAFYGLNPTAHPVRQCPASYQSRCGLVPGSVSSTVQSHHLPFTWKGGRDAVVSLDRGTKLGPYEILALIGAGGMGEVYKARDARLDRMVAVKISAGQFSDRFEREARAIAALNHPNI